MWFLASGQRIHGAKYYRGISNADYIKGLKPDTCGSAGSKMVGIISREHTFLRILSVISILMLSMMQRTV